MHRQVSMVGRAAFGAASQHAIRRLHDYYSQRKHQEERQRQAPAADLGTTPTDRPSTAATSSGAMSSKTRDTEWMRLQHELELQLAVVTPTIDLIELVAARGHSLLQPVLTLANDLRADVDAFAKKLDVSVSQSVDKSDADFSLNEAMARVSLDVDAAASSSHGSGSSRRRQSLLFPPGIHPSSAKDDEDILEAYVSSLFISTLLFFESLYLLMHILIELVDCWQKCKPLYHI
jgi:hypothetical protein